MNNRSVLALLLCLPAALPFGARAAAPLNPFDHQAPAVSLPESECPAAAQPGSRLVVGRFNQDALPDIAFSAPETLAANCPSITVLLSKGSGGFTPNGVFWSADPGDQFGSRLMAADLNGDDIDEMLVTAPEYGDRVGAAFLLEGSMWGGSSCELPVESAATSSRQLCKGAQRLEGPSSGAYFGNDVGLLSLEGESLVAVMSLTEAYLVPADELSTGAVLIAGTAGGADLDSLLGHNVWSSVDGEDLLLGNRGGKVYFCPQSFLAQAWNDATTLPVTVVCEELEPLGSSGEAVSALTPLGETSSLAGLPDKSAIFELTATETGTEVASPALMEMTESGPVSIAARAGFGAALLAVDLDGDRVPERVVSAIDPTGDDPTSEVAVFRISPGTAQQDLTYERLLVYSDQEIVDSRASRAPVMLGSSLASYPGVCRIGNENGSTPAPGLLLGAPGAPSYGLPPVILVCPQDHIDRDRDGSPLSLDCDDGDFQRSPDTPEQCDGIDNDCDAELDDGTWYPDDDGDGYGASTPYSGTCPASSELVGIGGDCDDADPAVHPGAAETCDGIDNNCDVAIDELFDLDRDGYAGCNGDCNDGDPQVHPNAAEICDGEDSDCEGGVPASETTNQDQDGFTECEEGAECDQRVDANPEAQEICDGIDNDCDGGFDEGLSDRDGDGFSDCIEEQLTGAKDCAKDPTRNPAKDELCDGVDNDCDGTKDEGYDADLDGHTTCGGDCDDYNTARYPGAVELCDGIDNNCDGRMDGTGDDFDQNQDGTADCIDDDRDGVLECAGQCEMRNNQLICSGVFGQPDAAECDCNDLRPDVYPDAPEGNGYQDGLLEPDGYDNDCDGTVDDETGAYDDDGDGYCELSVCLPRIDTSRPILPGDCDDKQIQIHPEAAEGTFDPSSESILSDGMDNDCDGLVDEGTDAFDDDGDGFCELEPGDPRLCSRRPDGTQPLPGDCADDTPARSPAIPEGDDADGLDNDCDGKTDEDTRSSDDDGDGVCEEGPCIDPSTGDVAETLGDGDCEDHDDEVRPGLSEVVNGQDDDCDEIIDEGTAAYDDDHDGWCEGVEVQDGERGCVPRADGAQPQPGDCGDGDPTIHPSAEERPCDGIDQDCDAAGMDGHDWNHTGLPDECDFDDDGYVEQVGVPQGGDCEDRKPAIHPGAEERCDDIDNDCNDFVDDDLGWCPGCSTSPRDGSRTGGVLWWGLLLFVAARTGVRRAAARHQTNTASGGDTVVPEHRVNASSPSHRTLLSLLALLFMGTSPVSAVAQQRCEAALDRRTLEAGLQTIRQALAQGNHQRARETALELRGLLLCLTTRIESREAVTLPMALAISSWYVSRDEEETRRRLREALMIESFLVLEELDRKPQASLQKLVSEERERLGQQARVNLTPGWRDRRQIYLDGRPFEKIMPVYPGNHLVQIEQPDRTFCTYTLGVPATTGKDVGATVRLENQPGGFAHCEEGPTLEKARTWPAWRTGLIVTGALGAAAIGSALELQGDFNELKERAGAGETCADPVSNGPLCDDFQTSKIRSWAVIGATVVAGGVTVWLYVSERRNTRLSATFEHGAPGLRFSYAW